MKSAFAFIAVAMMIMVAVVPMVSVFTESSDAVSGTPTVDPAMKDTDMVTIDVKVYSKGSTLAEDLGYGVNVAYKAGNGTYALTFSVTNGEATVMIAEEEVSEVTMTYVDDEGVAVPGYGKATLNDLTSGKYSAKIVNGLASKTFGFTFIGADTDMFNVLPIDAVLSGTYSVYTSNASDAKAYSEKNKLDADGTTTVYYPVDATNVYIKITDFGVTGTGISKGFITYTAPAELVELTDDDLIEVNEYLVTVEANTGITSFTVSKLVAKADEKDVKFNCISKEFLSNVVKAMATTKVKPSDLDADMTITIVAADKTEQDENVVKGSYEIVYEPVTADDLSFFGEVAMNGYNEAGTLSVLFEDEDGAATSKKAIDVTVDDSGKFFTFAPEGSVAVKEISFKTASISKIAVKSVLTDLGFSKSNDVELDDTGYELVKGTLKVGDTDLHAALKTMEVSGDVKTFGSRMIEDNNFEFMATAGATINFVFSDSAKYTGDISTVAGSDSENLEITMSTKKISVTVTDALGEDVEDADIDLIIYGLNVLTSETKSVSLIDGMKFVTEFSYVSDGAYTATARGDIDDGILEQLVEYALVEGGLVITGPYVSIETKSGDYTFDDEYEFVDGGVYMADEAAYTVSLYKSDGITLITGTAGSAYSVNTATAYKNSLGSIVYYDITPVSADSDGKYIVDASIVGYTKADITSVPVDVLILKTETSIDGIFDAYYVLDADAEGKIAITASVDSFTGKLVKNDGVTPVAGVKVEMYNSSTLVSKEAAYTQNDGSFTLYSDSKIVKGFTLKFTAGEALGYTFNDSDAVFNATTGEKETVFEVKTSTFKVSFVDADGAKIDLNGLKVTVGGVNVTGNATDGNVLKFSADWDGEKALEVTLVDSESNKVRTFEDIELEAAELAAGAFTVKSNQSTYTFSVVDANGKAIDNTGNVLSGDLYAYNGDIPVKGDALTIAADGTFKLVLPLVADDGKAVTYGYKVTSSNGYAFADVAKITEAINVVKSTSALKTVVLQDAAGEDLVTTAGTVKLFADGAEDTAPIIAKGVFSFVATAGVTYTYTFGDDVAVGTQKYTFDAKIADVDGVVKAKEETITGTVTDASGKATTFGTTGGVTAKVDVYDADGEKIIIDGVPLTSGVKTFTFVAEKSEVAYYIATIATTATAPVNTYTFEKSTVADIKANETKLLITLTTVNGVSKDIGAVDVTYTAGTEVNMPLVDTKYIIVDTTKVSEYSMTVGGNTYTSKTGAFVDYVADYSGSVGVPNVTGSVSYVIYKGSDVTGRGTGTVNAGKYELNDVDTSLGDKIVVTYVNSGKTYSAVLNTAAKTTELVEVVPLDTSLIVLSGETDKITCKGVSADGKYVYLLAEKSYTKRVMGSTSTGSDGHDLAEKFKFDGWYVNGEKVSGEISYTADNTEGNIVAAYYVSDGYYETNKPVDKTGNNSSVMIIGIAAVIIALIAVVYAVIQKKQ